MKPEQQTINMEKWPTDVGILEKKHTLTNPDRQPKRRHTRRIDDVDDYRPQAWARMEFRQSRYFEQIPSATTALMLEIWIYRYRCLLAIKWRYPNTYSDHDVYNAAWVACGYVNGQSDKAIELCEKRFAWTQDGYEPSFNGGKRA